MRFSTLFLFLSFFAVSIVCFADMNVSSSVDVSDYVMGVSTITYESAFFGYQSGINRDFTIYGRSFGDQVDIPFSAYETISADVVDGITAEILRWLSGEQVEITGDFTGEGVKDTATYDPETGIVRLSRGGENPNPLEFRFPGGAKGGVLIAEDFNADGRRDLALYKGSTVPDGFHFIFNHGEVFFVTTSSKDYSDFIDPYSAKYEWPSDATVAVAGNFDADGTPDLALLDFGTRVVSIRKAVSGGVTQPAYDYSVHLIKEGDLYRMWYGCRFIRLDEKGEKVRGGDGDHVCTAYSRDGRRWIRRSDAPALLKGEEEGYIGTWWSKNYLEPEVIKLGNLFYMYTQLMIDKEDLLDEPAVIAEGPADRMQLCLSPCGEKWTRFTERSVVINVDKPAKVKLTHHEVLYVPEDEQPFWFYVFWFEGGTPKGHVRMRSSDLFTFDWQKREHVSGMAQIGNQLAYGDTVDGKRVFFRITHSASEQGKRVPAMQVSGDGLKWSPPNALLAGCEEDLGCFFLGLSTIDGTGRLDRREDGSFHALYGATTAKTPVAPEIFWSEIGVGEVIIRIGE